jgi:hypothetical protein
MPGEMAAAAQLSGRLLPSKSLDQNIQYARVFVGACVESLESWKEL